MTSRQTTRELLKRLGDNWPGVTSSESDIVIALARLNGITRTQTNRVIQDYELTPAAFEVLATLRSMAPLGNLTPTELYRSNFLSSGGLTKVLKKLEDEMLISTISSKNDMRSKKVRLTAKGRKLAEKITERISQQDKDLFAKVSKTRIQALRSSLLEILDQLET